ncbi:hypothetical protein HNV11_04780 [Spirosoma taeanense]|uniref:Uncharacterized protein n=1 Tax=Spirosoma taeanense TaxID=2735870 RepID=A0A6M5Y7P0_9BACT|nr:hypothetical protein [Spirosoma taeanense]QJW88742.1 hypothetical protein HNV11_04780 [Spirosoma taeanense]
MTRIILNRTICAVVLFYILCLILAAYLKLGTATQDYYTLFKDLLPIIFAIPAAYLVFCFQRRNEYLKALRSVYSLLVQVNTEFTEYSYCTQKSDDKYYKLKSCISKVIEEIRSVYENIDEVFGAKEGLYPFEPLKEMYHEDLEELHNGDFTEMTNLLIRQKHYKKWKLIRINFIVELERAQAAFPITKYERDKIALTKRVKLKLYKYRYAFTGRVHDAATYG